MGGGGVCVGCTMKQFDNMPFSEVHNKAIQYQYQYTGSVSIRRIRIYLVDDIGHACADQPAAVLHQHGAVVTVALTAVGWTPDVQVDLAVPPCGVSRAWMGHATTCRPRRDDMDGEDSGEHAGTPGGESCMDGPCAAAAATPGAGWRIFHAIKRRC